RPPRHPCGAAPRHYFGLGGEPPIARLTVAEVLPHRLARRRRIARRDRGKDRDMLTLKGFEIGPLAFGTVRGDPDALAGNDEASEIFKKMWELRVAGRRGDHPMKREILVDRALATFQGRIDRGERPADPAT